VRMRRALTATSPEGKHSLAKGSEPCDILLIQPPIQDFYLTAKRTLPYGLITIAAVLQDKGYRVAILDGLARGKSRPAPLPPELGYLEALYASADLSPFGLFHQYRHYGYALTTIAEKASRSGAFLIGIASLFSAYEDMALECARSVKSMCPDARIVLGGHHPTQFPDRVLDHPAVDFVLRGDGEAGLPVLADRLREKGPLASVPGIAYDRKNGERCIRAPAYVDYLDQLPTPATELVKTRYYRRMGGDTLVIAASRGCPMHCSYCCMGAHTGIPYRRRSVNHVMQEIRHAARGRHIGLIDFEDENLSMDRGWFERLLTEIILFFGDRPPELRAMNGIYPPTLNRNLIARMRKAGFRELNLSLGSCDKDQTRRFRRPYVRDAFDRVLAWAEELDLSAVGYIIAGAPDQDPHSSIRDLLFLASRRVLVGLSIYYPAPASWDFAYCHKTGMLPSSPLCWRSTALSLDRMTRCNASLTLLRLSRLLNFMKQCMDKDGFLPPPEPFPNHKPVIAPNRHEMGRQLLGWFLEDGIIRGLGQHGEIVNHITDNQLTQSFLEGLREISIRGARSR